MTAVRDSVRRWERRRPEPGDHADWPTDGQLLDGYAAIGHRLAACAEISIGEATAAVSGMLADRWGLAPGAAVETAERILWFWDEHVGVFVRTDAGAVVARSRVFCEIASAMRVAALPDRRIAEWVAESLRHPDRDESLQLAAELEPRVIAALLTKDDVGVRQSAALVAAAAVQNGMVLRPDQMASLIDSLAWGATRGIAAPPTAGDAEPAIVRPEDRERQDTTEWACARELASLPLPAAVSSGTPPRNQNPAIPGTLNYHDADQLSHAHAERRRTGTWIAPGCQTGGPARWTEHGAQGSAAANVIGNGTCNEQRRGVHLDPCRRHVNTDPGVAPAARG